MLPQEALADYIRRYASSFKVIGWTIEGQYHQYTTDCKLCAKWHKSGYNVLPVYIQKEIEPCKQ